MIKTAEIRHSSALARLLLKRVGQGFRFFREFVMTRFENLAFSLGLVLTGLLSLSAISLA